MTVLTFCDKRASGSRYSQLFPRAFIAERLKARDPDTRNFSLAHLSPKGKKHALTEVAVYAQHQEFDGRIF